jgi:hypothetical protein
VKLSSSSTYIGLRHRILDTVEIKHFEKFTACDRVCSCHVAPTPSKKLADKAALTTSLSLRLTDLQGGERVRKSCPVVGCERTFCAFVQMKADHKNQNFDSKNREEFASVSYGSDCAANVTTLQKERHL